MKTGVTALAASLALSMALGATSPSRADTAGDSKAAAEVLFDQGKKLMAAGKFADACPKFEESMRLDAGVGTALWLGECYEKNGQTASAWAEFREAAAVAVRGGDAREKIGRERAKALESRLSRLVIVVPPSSVVKGIEVHRDGVAVGQAEWGAEVPVDPGKHPIDVTAPGKKAWHTDALVPATAGSVSVSVPALEDGPVEQAQRATEPPKDEPLPEPARSDGKTLRTAGIVVAGAGVVSVIVGSAFGLSAKSKNNESNTGTPPPCDGQNHCTGPGVALRSSALGAATASTVFFIVGGVALAAGAVLYLTAPKAKATVALVPAASPQGGSLLLHASF